MKIIIELHEINEVSVSAHFSNVACANGDHVTFLFLFLLLFALVILYFTKFMFSLKFFPEKAN